MINQIEEFCIIPERELLTPLPKISLPEGAFLCGGCIRDSIIGDKINDYDIFVNEKELIDKVINENFREGKTVYESEMLKTVIHNGKKWQVIHRPGLDTLEDILNSFDFTICQFGYDGKQIYGFSDSLIHLFRKKLVINHIFPEFAVDTLQRMQKYIKKGYTACNGTIRDIATNIRAISDQEFEDQFQYYHGDKSKVRIIRFD